MIDKADTLEPELYHPRPFGREVFKLMRRRGKEEEQPGF
jgi:hypothetical protein